MNIKYVYASMVAILLTLIPIKLISYFMNYNVGLSYFFIIPAILILIAFIFIVSKMDTFGSLNFKRLNPNVILGILSLILISCFACCSVIFLTEQPDYDTASNYYILSVASILTAVSFILVSISHFTGKNMFKKFKFMIFMPAVYFVLSIMLFLSLAKIQDGYEMASQSFLTLFFVYFCRVFVNCPDRTNVIKRLFLFGIGGFLLTLMSRIPSIISVLTLHSKMFSVECVTSFTYLIASIYAISFVCLSFKENIQDNLRKA